MTNRMFPLFDKFNLYSRKGVKLKILKELVHIFYSTKGYDDEEMDKKRKELMKPLVDELQKKIPVTPETPESPSPYRTVPKQSKNTNKGKKKK
jgi:hypothetical protein